MCNISTPHPVHDIPWCSAGCTLTAHVCAWDHCEGVADPSTGVVPAAQEGDYETAHSRRRELTAKWAPPPSAEEAEKVAAIMAAFAA